MPSMVACPQCGKQVEKRRLEGHLRASHPEATIADPHPEAPESAPEGETMGNECISCQLKDRDLRDLGKERDQLAGQVKTLIEAESKREAEHLQLGELLKHGRAGDCPKCRADLEQHNQVVIKAALENISIAALRDLAISRGAVPGHITVRIPSGR